MVRIKQKVGVFNCSRHASPIMKLFSADATISKKNQLFFAHKKLKKTSQKVAQFFFSHSCQNGPQKTILVPKSWGFQLFKTCLTNSKFYLLYCFSCWTNLFWIFIQGCKEPKPTTTFFITQSKFQDSESLKL